MNIEDFSDHLIYHAGTRLSNVDRPYLYKIFASYSGARRLVLCTGRQVEKTSLVIKILAYTLLLLSPATCLLVLPRQEQIHRAMRSRLLPIFNDSPVLKRCLVPRPQSTLKHLQFDNGSELIADSAFHNPDAVRGVSAGFLFLDEYQDAAPGCLQVLEESQSHFENPKTVITGTAKLSDNQLEQAFWCGTANVWMTTCSSCNASMPADHELLTEDGYRCTRCKHPVDPHVGVWQPSNPGSTFGESFRIPQIITPWTTFAKVNEKKKFYSHVQLRNEVFGESVSQGDLQLSMQELTACCTDRPFFYDFRDIPAYYRMGRIVAGVDWGNTALATTSVTVGMIDPDLNFHVLCWHRLEPGKKPDDVLNFVAQICKRMNVGLLSVDGQGNGSVYRQLLFERLQNCDLIAYAVQYTNQLNFSITSESLQRFVLNVGKIPAVSNVVFSVKALRLHFPRLLDSQSFLAEIASERCIPEDDGRGFRYSRSPGRPDDALHSLIYAVSAANHIQAHRPYL